MKHLIKVIIIMASFFALTFILLKMTNVLSIEQIKIWLLYAKTISPYYLGSIVIILLFADLFIAIPTMSIITLSGYFLGFQYGAIASLCGLLLAGTSGYALSNLFEEKILSFLLKKESERYEAKKTFRQHSFIMILLSRAIPILPEVTACLAGMTSMKFSKFMLAWSISTVPYVLIISYAGSISSIENPKPAIFTAIGISVILWIGWYLFHKNRNRKTIFK